MSAADAEAPVARRLPIALAALEEDAA